MKKRMKTPAFIAIWTSAAVVLLALGIAFMLMATTFSNVFVSLFSWERGTSESVPLEGTEDWDADYYSYEAKSLEEATANANKLEEEKSNEGFVLLKNESNALPLKTGADGDTIAMYGRASVDPILGGSGSGNAGSAKTVVRPYDSLKEEKFEMREDVYKFFGDNYSEYDKCAITMDNPDASTFFIGEIPVSAYSGFTPVRTDVALVFIGRGGGEGWDLSKDLKESAKSEASVSAISENANTAAEVVNALSGARNACFLPDAGAVVTGRTLAEVYTCALVLDKASNGWLLAEPKGGAQHLNAFEAWLEHMVYKLKYSKKNQTSQKAAEEGKEVDTAEKPSAIDTDELKAVAQEIKDAGVKLLEENLVQGTWGNIAVRLDDKEMMATPSALDYVMLKPEQMAIVNMESMEWRGSNKPTSEKGVHAEILKMHPESNVTVHTHPFYGSILAAMRKPLEVPERYRAVLGDVVPVSKFAPSGTPWLVKNVAAAIGDAPACIIASHGVVVRGKDMDEAFAVCRALEDACRDYLTE